LQPHFKVILVVGGKLGRRSPAMCYRSRYRKHYVAVM